MTNTSVADVLASIDARIDEAVSDGDFDIVSPMLADDFIYTHSSGTKQSKDEWIEGLRRLVGQRRRVPSAINVEAHGDIAVVTGDLDVVWVDRPSMFDRYVRVYRHDGTSWKLISQRTFPAADRHT